MKTLKILIADDAQSNQSRLDHALKQHVVLDEKGEEISFDISFAANGKQAVKKVEEALEEKSPFDLIIMDHEMPEMDGLTATLQIRQLECAADLENPARIFSYSTTAGEDKSIMDQYSTLRIAGQIKKDPLNISDLMTKITQGTSYQTKPIYSSPAVINREIPLEIWNHFQTLIDNHEKNGTRNSEEFFPFIVRSMESKSSKPLDVKKLRKAFNTYLYRRDLIRQSLTSRIENKRENSSGPFIISRVTGGTFELKKISSESKKFKIAAANAALIKAAVGPSPTPSTPDSSKTKNTHTPEPASASVGRGESIKGSPDSVTSLLYPAHIPAHSADSAGASAAIKKQKDKGPVPQSLFHARDKRSPVPAQSNNQNDNPTQYCSGYTCSIF